MWLLKVNREKFSGILISNGKQIDNEITQIDGLPSIPVKGDDLYLIWDNITKNKRDLPNIIFVADGHVRDFLAWANTYFPNFTPFTAYFRVLEFSMMESLKSWVDYPYLNGLEDACLGLILGEALLLSSAAQKKSTINPMTGNTTISYTLARALALGAGFQQMSLISENWTLARKLTDQPLRNIDIKNIITIFETLSLLRSEGYKYSNIKSSISIPISIVEACFEIKNQGTVSDELWKKISRNNPILINAQENMKATREERVRFFQKILSGQLYFNSQSDVEQSFILGYLGSLIGPGTLSHFDLVERCTNNFPSALLWYGLCAGLYEKNEILNSFNGLGRRLLRELFRPESMFEKPTCDISISELKLYIEGERPKTDFRTFASNRIYVELYPGISTYLIWQIKKPEQQPEKQIGMFKTSEEFLNEAKLLSELGSYLQKASEIYNTISVKKDLNSSSQQKTKSLKKKIRWKKAIKD
ncbi:MAG: hypothetical protein ABIJ52_18300 [Pseudomonadota bacterium]